jgi:nucleotide-binding universal stress UspA family protein
MFRRIVVPLDGTSLAEVAIVQAADLARMGEVLIRLIRVVDDARLERYVPYVLALERGRGTDPGAKEAQAKEYLPGRNPIPR